MKTIYAKRKWYNYLCGCAISTANGSTSVRALRSIWGQNACIVRCNGYLFRVPERVFAEVSTIPGPLLSLCSGDTFSEADEVTEAVAHCV